MHLGEFRREVEYLDPGLPVEEELVEQACNPADELIVETEKLDLYPDAAPVKV